MQVLLTPLLCTGEHAWIENLLQLCHPAIVELVDYFFTYERVCVETDDDGDDESEEDVKSLVMVLELVAGEALFDVIRDSDDGYLPEHVARRYMRDMIESV